jgi:hypothetical protein
MIACNFLKAVGDSKGTGAFPVCALAQRQIGNGMKDGFGLLPWPFPAWLGGILIFEQPR